MELKQGDAAFIDNYDCVSDDSVLLNWINKNGLTACGPLKMSEPLVIARAEWLCEMFKQFKDKNNEKKKKTRTDTSKEMKRRTKF